MQLIEHQLVHSASDLTGFLACPRLPWLNRGVAEGRRSIPPQAVDGDGELSARKGIEHEQRHLEVLRAQGLNIAEISVRHGAEGTAASASATSGAMRDGVDVVYQAVFSAGAWLGHADFLVRVDVASELGEWSYVAVDTKLARSVKPYFVVQLSLYSELLGAEQGRAPDWFEVVLGDGRHERLRARDFDAYVRRLRDRYLRHVATTAEPYPEPVGHCSICRWRDPCAATRLADDHLSQVAGIRGDQTLKLRHSAISTMAQLGAAPQRPPALRIGADTYDRLHAQAALQVRGREYGTPRYDVLEPEPRKGFALLPEPSPHDLFFDMEGDPYYDSTSNLEYLFGVEYPQDGAWRFRAFWGCSRKLEREAFEQFVDWAIARWRANPDLHIYHYAHYEPVALKRLAGQHGTREQEVDELLKHGVFVDLFAVVRHAVRISRPSYSIKELEAFYRDEQRTTAVGDGGESIRVFEQWLETGDQALLDAIEEYNADDCRSTRELRDWLLERRSEAWNRFGEAHRYEPPDPYVVGEDEQAIDDETRVLIEELLDGVGAERDDRTGEQQGRWLLAQLLGYHRRERRAAWWRFYDLCDKDHEQLLEDLEAISGLEPEGEPLQLTAQSTGQWFSFPAQEFKFDAAPVKDPATQDDAGEVVQIDAANRRLLLKRTPAVAGAPLPRAVFPFQTFQDKEHRRALRDLAAVVLRHGLDGDGPALAARRLLLGGAPRVDGVAPGEALHSGELSLPVMTDVIARLDRSPLFVQGPPGSGKTYRGARVIAELLRRGKRVGITSNSHKAICNLLADVDAATHEAGVEVRATKRSSSAEQDYVSTLQPAAFQNARKPAQCEDPQLNLVAGTSWLFVREAMVDALDYLFVDEAGQLALANIAAMTPAARNLVLLGDPQQLAQVSQASHPDGAGGSALEHLLGERSTVHASDGLFLEHSWRMHPDICAFISDLAYDNRLEPGPGAHLRRVQSSGLSGAGLRFIPVEHEGNRQSSSQEAARIATEVDAVLADGWVTDDTGTRRRLTAADVLVVAAYNHQVACIREQLRDDVAVGTVDRFQGQEAPIVFYSLATSAPELAPRGIDFLFSRNRLNVAISRAQCIAVVVGNPALLDAECRTVEQMRLVNGACKLVEQATWL